MNPPIVRRLRAHLTPRHASVAAAALLLAVVAPRVYAQSRIAVVDVQRAIPESQQGQRAFANLRTLFQKRQEDLNARQDVLTRMRDSLQKEAKLSEGDHEARNQRAANYQRAVGELQQNYDQYQQELSQREAELTKAIYTNMDKVIRQVGGQEHYAAVFDRQGVVWSPQDMDLTDRVIQLYNQQFPPSSAPTPTPLAPVGGTTSPTTTTTTTTTTTSTTTPVRPPVNHTVINPHPRDENPPPHAHQQ